MQVFLQVLILISYPCLVRSDDLDVDLPVSYITVNKCCPEEELLNDRQYCRHVNDTGSTAWSPYFTDQYGRSNIQVKDFRVVHGPPDCGNLELRLAFDYPGSDDKFALLPTGVLRHYTHHQALEIIEGVGDHVPSGEGSSFSYDHQPGSYCLDKGFLGSNLSQTLVAMVCVPSVPNTWTANFVFRRIVDPILHIVGIACLLTVAIVYFVLPPLRDLVGNILSSISICLIVSQAADLVRIYTEFENHISFMVADVVMYTSLLGAFLWLNSLGYYIWRTFRSRNVFLRVSDGRKYCYYSVYAWGTALVFTFIALAAHFLFAPNQATPITPSNQESIGLLGMAMFFTPIAFTILIDISFYLTTARAISRMATYGRIHSRMKFSFALYIQLFIVMTTAWLFLLLSWLHYDAFIYINILVNALCPAMVLFICVLGQKSVRSMLRKGCCQGDHEPQWGEEMMSMTSS